MNAEGIVLKNCRLFLLDCNFLLLIILIQADIINGDNAILLPGIISHAVLINRIPAGYEENSLIRQSEQWGL